MRSKPNVMAKIKQPDERTPSTPGPKPKLVYSAQVVEQIRALARIQCTVDEVAAVIRHEEGIGVSVRTLQNFFETYPDAKAAHEDGKLEGHASLRRKQFSMADTNPAMAIWLGKQYLGQREPVRQLEVGKPGAFEEMDDDQLREYIELTEREYKEIEQSLLPAPEPKSRKQATKH